MFEAQEYQHKPTLSIRAYEAMRSNEPMAAFPLFDMSDLTESINRRIDYAYMRSGMTNNAEIYCGEDIN